MNNTEIPIPTFTQPEAGDFFLASENGLRTYGQLNHFRSFFLQCLFDSGHDFSKPVGFLAASSDELIFSLAACWQLGLPFVCFNPEASKLELEQQTRDLEPGLIFIDEERKNKFTPDNAIQIKKLALEQTLNKDTKLGKRAKKFIPSLDPEQVFGYFFTSGTTGKSKIVPLKRRQIYFAANASAKNFKPRRNHFWLLCLPLNHISGVSIVLRSLLYGSGIYRTDRFKVDMVSKFLSENKLFQAASLVPTMLKRILKAPTFQTHNNFKAILLGGGPVDLELLKETTNRGIPLVSSYGMTETCAQIAANHILKPSGRYIPLKSVGEVFAPNHIEIRDSENKKLGANNPGSIWLKGPQVFDGYLNKEISDSSFDNEGWFNTGDFGRLNAKGQLFVEARRTDLIVTGGENVSPFEVESELEKIDSITEAAVFGIEDKEWGQRVVAVVVAKTNGKLEIESIRQKLKERITPYKVPKEIKQTETLPRTESGKVKRGELLKLFE